MSWLFRITFSIGLTLITLFGGSESRAVERSLKVTVRFFNYAQLPQKLLQDAKERTSTIFQRAGLEIAWAACPVGTEDPSLYPDCTESWDRTHLFLRISANAPKGTKTEKGAEAIVSARIVNIFWDRLQHQAERLQVSKSRLLAHTISHEMGHLLLGSNSHSPTGIMAARWGPQDLINISQQGLDFNKQQSEFMRAEVSRRQNEARYAETELVCLKG